MFDTVGADGTKITHWRHMFYVFGAIGAIWCVAWWWWYRDNPAKKAGVNAAELSLIRHGTEHSHDKLVVPWKKLLTSTNLWLLCIMYFCSSYGWYLYITYWPGFLKEQLNIEPGPEKWTRQFWIAGFMAGLPLLVGAVGCLIGGLLTDSFIKRTGNRKWGRRLFGVHWARPHGRLFFHRPFLHDEPVDFRDPSFARLVLERYHHGFGVGELPRYRQTLLGHRRRLHEHRRQSRRRCGRDHDGLDHQIANRRLHAGNAGV